MGPATCGAGEDARRAMSYASTPATSRLVAAIAASTIRRFALFAMFARGSLSRSNGRVDLRRTTPDLVDVQRAGFIAGHPGRPHGHTRQGDPDDLRLLGHQPVDAFHRESPANDDPAD